MFLKIFLFQLYLDIHAIMRNILAYKASQRCICTASKFTYSVETHKKRFANQCCNTS